MFVILVFDSVSDFRPAGLGLLTIFILVVLGLDIQFFCFTSMVGGWLIFHYLDLWPVVIIIIIISIIIIILLYYYRSETET